MNERQSLTLSFVELIQSIQSMILSWKPSWKFEIVYNSIIFFINNYNISSKYWHSHFIRMFKFQTQYQRCCFYYNQSPWTLLQISFEQFVDRWKKLNTFCSWYICHFKCLKLISHKTKKSYICIKNYCDRIANLHM